MAELQVSMMNLDLSNVATDESGSLNLNAPPNDDTNKLWAGMT